MGECTGVKNLTFQPAVPEDADLIFAQCKELVTRYEDSNKVDMESVLQWLYKKIHGTITSYTCVILDGEKVAFFSFCRDEHGFELDDLYVLEPYRNQGIGSQILEHCIASAGDGVIFLYVFNANLGAIRLYRRYGFDVTDQVSSTRSIMKRCP